MSFASLKKQSNLGSLTATLVKEVEKVNNSSGGGDERLWKPELDKSGNGYAVIRFLPAPDKEDLPFVKLYSHAFKGPGGWYIENSLTTLGQKDPVSEYNSQLWNNGTDAGKELARKQKRKLTYIANIYVVKDPTNPENEGQTFLYKFGKKIFDKLNDQMNPTFEDEDPVNPFDLWEGANFRLKIRQFEGYPNYDKSEFDAPTPLLDDDEAMESVWNQQHSLQQLVEPSNFKSYDELKQKLYRVLDLASETPEVAAPSPYETTTTENDDLDISSSIREAAPSTPDVAETNASSVDDDDDDLAIFKDLARN